LGHQRFGHLSSALEAETFQLRRDTVAAVLERAGLAPAVERRAPFTFEAAAVAARELLVGQDRPTAIYADDDLLAGGVYMAARELGLRIPGDVSVVGFDDLPFARVFEPALTTIRIDPETLGSAAFEVLEAAMTGAAEEPEARILPVELVVRESTGPPP
jgi:DNA-binding LacI/PurR family transcriptional regulator